MRGAKGALLDDPGFGWHLRNIDAMIAHGGWLTEDPFTDPRGEAPAALADEPVARRTAGVAGVEVGRAGGHRRGHALALALLGRFLYTALIDDGLPWPLAVAGRSSG